VVKVALERPAGWVVVVADRPGVDAGVWIDGQKTFQGALPARVKALAGSREVRISGADPGEFLESTVEVADGEESVVKWMGTARTVPRVVEPRIDVKKPVRPTRRGVSPVKAALFWGGIGVAAAGGAVHLWGYIEWRNANDGKHYWGAIESARTSATRKYWSAFAMYGAGAAAIAASFLVPAEGRHPLVLSPSPAPGGMALSAGWPW
jgi:hypothetical protein